MFESSGNEPQVEKPVYTFKEITRLRKAGQLEDAWNLGVVEVQANPDDKYLKSSFFWVCYDYLKLVQNPIIERAKGNNNLRPREQELERINFLLDWILWLNLPFGGFEYPRLVFLFKKNLEYIPKLVQLVAEGQVNLFLDEDKEPFNGEHGELPSLMLSAARQVAKAWLDFGSDYALDVESVLLLLDSTRKQVKDKKHLIWLDYDEAKCLIKARRYDDARKFVIPVLKKKKNEAWAWGALAATYIKEEPPIAIKLFAEGIGHAHDEKFALKLLKGVAPLLAAQGRGGEASMCVKRATECYELNGWRIREDLQKLLDSPWYNATCDLTEMDAFISSARKGAEEYLFGVMAEASGLVINLHKSGKGCHIYLKPGLVISSPFGNFKGRKPNLAEYVVVKYSGSIDDMAVRSIEICEKLEVPGLEYISGELRVNPKGFGFVDDTFVPPNLIKPDYEGLTVKVLRFKDMDKVKKKLGWKAATLEVVR